MQIRYDKAKICQDKNSWQKLTDGRLRVPVTLTRTGIFNYYDEKGTLIRELRSDDEVLKEDSLNTLKGMYFTDEHPPEMIDTSNYDKYSKGTFGDVITTRKDGDITYIDTFLTIFDKDTQVLIQSGKKEQISCGYLCNVVFTSGIWNGLNYDAKQENIDYNHGSLVDLGRAGNNVKIRRDSEEITAFYEKDLQIDSKEKNIIQSEVKRKMLINGREVVLDAAGEIIVSQALEQKESEIVTLKEKVKNIDTLEAKLLNSEKALKEAKEINLDSLVDERNSIIEKAKNVLKADSFKGVSNAEIMKNTVLEAYKGTDLSKKEDSFFPVAFELLELKNNSQPKQTLKDGFNGGNQPKPEEKEDSDSLLTLLMDSQKKADNFYNKDKKEVK